MLKQLYYLVENLHFGGKNKFFTFNIFCNFHLVHLQKEAKVEDFQTPTM